MVLMVLDANRSKKLNVAILTKFPSQAAPKVVILTTFGAANNEYVARTAAFPFQWFTDPTSFDF